MLDNQVKGVTTPAEMLLGIADPQKRGETMTNRNPKELFCGVPRDAGGTGTYPAEDLALLHTRNFFLPTPGDVDRWFCVVHLDHTDIRAQTAELQKIGVNVNQIARRLNSMGPLYTQDVADIKGALAQIWQLQRYILSSQR